MSQNAKVLIESQYFPTIAFFSLLHTEGLVLDQHENYHKGSYRNRATILSSQGPLHMSVPLKSGKNRQTNITEVQIDNGDQWQMNHKRSIDACYGKSPYFEYYIHYFEPLFTAEQDKLWDLNLQSIEICCKILRLENQPTLSNSFLPNSSSEYKVWRERISPKKKNQHLLEPWFNFIPYDQVFSDEHPFVPNLSILDLIFCLGPEARIYLTQIRT